MNTASIPKTPYAIKVATAAPTMPRWGMSRRFNPIFKAAEILRTAITQWVFFAK